MKKLYFILLVALAPTGAFANEVTTLDNQLSNALTATIESASINNGLSALDAFADQKQAEIYDYADNVFTTITANIEKDFLNRLEQHFAVRITSR